MTAVKCKVHCHLQRKHFIIPFVQEQLKEVVKTFSKDEQSAFLSFLCQLLMAVDPRLSSLEGKAKKELSQTKEKDTRFKAFFTRLYNNNWPELFLSC